MLWRNDRTVLDAATEAVGRLRGDPAHTVAAAAMDLSGRVHTAVNVSHFTGGPCAELAVLGAAAAVSDDPVMTIVAVADRGRGVIPPCGRCRQVLLDLQPQVLVLMPGQDDPVGTPVRDLLPGAYDWPDAGASRVVRFSGRYRDDVLAGRKTATIRFRDPQGVGPTTFVFEDEDAAGFARVDAVIESVTAKPVAEIDERDAHDEGVGSVAALRDGLAGHYPQLGAADVVEVVRFRVTGD
ncbi:ASCH domain-containing protein [Curtobacterium sp. 9128]|uniref:ASCH domain-containing protein n=1 Tax=Curtobacterium sp. 9128 TaxID=1793722 RepID=UPI0016424D17|nr:ASCH domain-containing protein [Curtobacterium sp. 9128]